MLLTLTSTHPPATDLGYLLGKNPARCQTFPLGFGQAHVFFPEASQERCTMALLLDIDPVGLVRRPRGEEAWALEQYTNDRPYVASSFMSVAIGQVLGSALSGTSKQRPELAGTTLALEASLSTLPCRGGETFLRRLFEPLGYQVEARCVALDADHPEWGGSRIFAVTLRGQARLAELLRHLTVLIPVLDGAKHYFVAEDEVDKLLARGEGWLAQHPEKEEITGRYLKRFRSLTDRALRRLAEAPEVAVPDDVAEEVADAPGELGEEALEAAVVAGEGPEAGTAGAPATGVAADSGTTAAEPIARPPSLARLRQDAVLAVLLAAGARSVLDLGCGEGHLLQRLVRHRGFERLAGLEVSLLALERAQLRLRLAPEGAPPPVRPSRRPPVELLHGSLVYRDRRLRGFDAACAVEVIEHLDAERLDAFAEVLFAHTRPATVILTTPNREYNVRFPTLAPGKLRHRDHRFEWTRVELRAWAEPVAARYGYEVSFTPIGPEDAEVGAPTQMAVLRLAGAAAALDGEVRA